MTVSDDKKFDALVGHYKDSFAQTLPHIKRRDRIFRILLIILVVMLFELLSGYDIYEDLLKLLKLKWKIAASKTFMDMLFWALFFGFSFRYYQCVVAVERNYEYIHKLEDKISCVIGSLVLFTREGKWYLSDRPAILRYAHGAYVTMIPPVLIIGAIARIVTEYEQSIMWWVSAVFCLAAVSVLAHYIWFRHKKK